MLAPLELPLSVRRSGASALAGGRVGRLVAARAAVLALVGGAGARAAGRTPLTAAVVPLGRRLVWPWVEPVVAVLARRTSERVFVPEPFEVVALVTLEWLPGWEERARSPPESAGDSGVAAGGGVGAGFGLGLGFETGCVEGFVFLGAGFDTTVCATGVTTVCATGACTGAATGSVTSPPRCAPVRRRSTAAEAHQRRDRLRLGACLDTVRAGSAAAWMTLEAEPAATLRVGCEPFEP